MIYKFLTSILFLLLLATAIEAATLNIGETSEIGGKIVTLESIGSFGSLVLSIENQSEPLIIKQYGNIQYIGNFEIKVNRRELKGDGGGFIEYELIKKEIKCNSDLDCNDNNDCTIDTCNEEKCLNLGESCESNGECFQKGFTLNNAFCEDNKWLGQKSLEEACNNNYECLSNYCLNNKCTGFLIGETSKKGFFDKVTGYSIKRENKKTSILFLFLGILLIIKGVFLVIVPKKLKKALPLFKHYTSKFFRIFGITLIAIGFLFIKLLS